MLAAAFNTDRYAGAGVAYPIPVKPAAEASARPAAQHATLVVATQPLHRVVRADRGQREQA